MASIPSQVKTTLTTYWQTVAYENFEKDADDAKPTTRWAVTEDSANVTLRVQSYFDGYRKVVKIYDNDGTDNGDMTRTFSTAQTSGSVFFLIQFAQVNKDFFIELIETSTTRIKLKFDTSANITSYNGSDYDDLGADVAADTWYLFRLTFDCAADTFDLDYTSDTTAHEWTNISTDTAFISAATNLSKFKIETDGTGTGTWYVAAFDMSWDTTYGKPYETDRMLYSLLPDSNRFGLRDEDVTLDQNKNIEETYGHTPNIIIYQESRIVGPRSWTHDEEQPNMDIFIGNEDDNTAKLLARAVRDTLIYQKVSGFEHTFYRDFHSVSKKGRGTYGYYLHIYLKWGVPRA